MSKLSICLLTYNRMEYAKLTIAALFDHLIIPRDWEVYFHIADDGSPEGYAEELQIFAEAATRQREAVLPSVSMGKSNSNRRGYGANYNIATMSCHYQADWVMPIEDDWVLAQDLNLAELAQVFNDYPEVGCIRLGYLGFTQELRAKVIGDRVKYLLLDPYSPEPHVFSGHPRLETVAWARSVGPWPEGLNPGETEFHVSTVQARTGIAWPMDLSRSCGDLFQHVGTIRSYNA